MSDTSQRLTSPSGLSAILNANGSLRRMDAGEVAINLFPGNELEGGCTNLYLRRYLGNKVDRVALLGPASPTRFAYDEQSQAFVGEGEFLDTSYRIALLLAKDSTSWFWHVAIENRSSGPQFLDLIYAQDLALAAYGAIRLNEFYVSQYLDHTPLQHSARGVVIASRQNQAVSGKFPWSIVGSLRRGVAFATDALQVHGNAGGAGIRPVGLDAGLGEKRLQHEHSMAAIQDERITLAAGERTRCGFFGSVLAHHPAATSGLDLELVEAVLALPEARFDVPSPAQAVAPAKSLFTAAAALDSQELSADEITQLCGSERTHAEQDEQGRLLSFFHDGDRHVVLRAKELQVLRPHGHLLRTGKQLVPDETALTSTTWMAGVFHSMVTQGHVSINRFLSTTHSYIGLFRSHGLRVFAEIDGHWRLLDMPSAYEMAPGACRWIYRHAGGTIEVRSLALSDPHELSLEILVSDGPTVRFLVSQHIALNGDDGSTTGAANWKQQAEGITVAPAAGTELAQRFPSGDFLIAPFAGTRFEQVGGDELLFVDGQSRQQPFVCVITAKAAKVGLTLQGRLIATSTATEIPAAPFKLSMKAPSTALGSQVKRLEDVLPWFSHNALIHYLSPRGLEQYSGGGWGTRDVSQGPVELLLASGQTAPVRDLLLRVFSAQNADGDWPQWFMFFPREKNIRAGDSHGDIVFWPVLALAHYLIASGDAAVLEEAVPFFDGESATVWQHLQRSLQLIERRIVAGTALAAYGHGDWNDSLQPADPTMREHMCSAWTVTLHRQMLITLAQALRSIGRESDAIPLEQNAAAVQKDFQRLLLVDDVLAGYAFFESASTSVVPRAAGKEAEVRYLLHPRDATSGVHYSSLAMIHAILEDMLTPDQVRDHLRLIDAELTGPDGVRLFDRPMRYHGGPMQFFQRAESATFFGREIGLMYMHAHLRFAQALAHLGEADRFFKALCQANPIGLRELVPQATLRQSNCYYSSSDAAFADRADASDHYDRVAAGTIALDGGWRVYSSGAGIAFSLVVRRFLGLNLEASAISLDPVIPSALSGLQVVTSLFGQPLTIIYTVGPRGSGVQSVELNGTPLQFERESNYYRVGAARISRAAFDAALKNEGNELRIAVA
jgi:cellobiose phosphorylase